MARLVDARDRIRDAIMRAGHLCGHQIDIVVARDGKQHVRVAYTRFPLDIHIDAITLDKLDAFELRGAAKPRRFFIDERNLVASLQ